MQLSGPVIITPRLMPGVRVGDAYISIEYFGMVSDARTRYRYYIDLPGYEHSGDDLQSGCGGGSLQSGLESLLCFLSVCGESVSYASHAGEFDENAELFPPAISEWCVENHDELYMLENELQEGTYIEED